MTERSVFIRLKVKDGDRAVRELKKLGISGERSLKRVERAS